MKKTIKKITHSFFALLLVTTTLVINPLITQAEDSNLELNQTQFVDEITFHEFTTDNDNNVVIGDEKHDFWHGEQIAIKIDFSEKANNKITPNHTLTLDVPKDLDAFARSGANRIELKNDHGIIFGYAETSPNRSQLIVTFNDDVLNEYEFKGSFYFALKAGFSGNAEKPNIVYTDEYTTTLGTDFSEIPYTISTKIVIGTNPFFYKPGGSIWTSDPDHVNWSLNVNRDRNVFLSDIEITDTLHSGQKFEVLDSTKPITVGNLNPNYFSITRQNDAGSHALSPQEFVESGYGTLEFVNNNEFVITILKDKAAPNYEYTIMYQTKITPEGKYQANFFNDAIGRYTDEKGEFITKEQLNREAKNISSGGVIAPEKGVLRIMKLAIDGDNSSPLGDVAFKIFNDDGTEVDYIDSNLLHTNKNGLVDSPPLRDGKYYITEINAPDFVTFDPSEKYPFELKEGSQKGIVFIISNEVVRTDVSVDKVWNDTKAVHPEIFIDLYANDILTDTVALANGDTHHTFTNLPKYKVTGEKINYSVVERDVAGYDSVVTQLNDNQFVITNTMPGALSTSKNTSKSVVSVNEPFTYTITVSNTIEGSQPLKNISVKDTLPEGIHFKDGVISVNGTPVVTSSNVNSFEIILDTVAYGDDSIITFEAYAEQSAKGTYTNVAVITNPEDPTHPQEPEIPVTVIPAGNIYSEKFVNTPNVKPLEVFTYSILVRNTVENSDSVKNVSVLDVLPEGIHFKDKHVYLNGTLIDASIIENTLSLTLDDVPYGKDMVITFDVYADASTQGIYTNVATITNPGDPENPQEPKVPVTVTPVAKLSSEKSVDKTLVKPFETFTYSIKVANTTEGSNPLKNITIVDKLPEGIHFKDGIIRLNNQPIQVSISDDTFSFTLDTLSFGDDMTLTFDVYADVSAKGIYTNIATIINPEDPGNPQYPEVPVTVTPEEPLIPMEPQQPGTPVEAPILPNTGVNVSTPLLGSLLVLVGLSLRITRKKKEL